MSNTLSEQKFNLRRIRNAFDRAANTYYDAAVLQHEVGKRMLESLEYIRLDAKTILDAGCGTGETIKPLQKKYKPARLIALDISENMLQQSRKQAGIWNRPDYICADISNLPIADNTIDLLFSNVAIQWCNDLSVTFAEFYRVLAPGGLLMFSSFGPDTLKELRHCWKQIDDAVHVNDFIDMHDIGDMLLHAGMSAPVMHAENIVMNYQDVSKLMQDLREIGANVTAQGHRRGLLTQQGLARVYEAYEQYRTEQGLPATYEVLYGHAWKPDNAVRQKPSVVTVELQG